MRSFRVLLSTFALVVWAPCVAAASAPDKVVLQLRWDHQFQFAGYYAALWQGYYARAGLDVEIRTAIRPDKSIIDPAREIAEGRAHFGILGTDLLIKREQGIPLVILASVFQQSSGAVFALDTTPLSTPSDLLRLKVAIKPTSMVNLEMQTMLKAEGIDLTRLNTVPIEAGIDQLLTGAAEAMTGYHMTDPWLAKEAGVQLNELRPDNFGIHFYGDTLVTSEALVDRDPKLAKRFLEASRLGWIYALTHTEEVAARITSEFQRVVPVKDTLGFNLYQADMVREAMLYPFVPVGNINPERWHHISEYLTELGALSGAARPEDFIYDPAARAEASADLMRQIVVYGGFATGIMFFLFLIWTGLLRQSVATATSALRASEARIRAITDALPVLISYVDKDGRYRFNNKAHETYFSASSDDILGRHISEVFGPDVYERMSTHVANALTGKNVRYECADQRGDRTYFQDVIYVSDVHESGDVKGFYALIHDTTDRKRIEAALFEEKERAQVTLHSIGDAVITTNAEGCVEYLNPIAETLTGWTSAEARGLALSRVFRIISEDTREPIADPVSRCLKEGKIIGLASHSILVNRAGREYAIEDTAAPIRHRDGQLVGAVLVFHDVSEARRMARQLAHDAAHDPLTGLINRREFEKRLQRTVASAKQDTSHHVLCYLDLDQFKLINDAAGHAAGDELLKRVWGLLAGKFRERDTFARLGGDEFGLLLNNCTLKQAEAICQVIVTTIRNYRFNWADRTYQIGVSIGLVQVTADAESADELLGQADVACYTAKEQGRNQFHVYQRDGTEPSRRHTEIILASGLQEALEEDRFCLYCQPIVALSSGLVRDAHYEVLLRLVDQCNTRSPSTFIPPAERYGLMAAIDRWVVHKALSTYPEVFGNNGTVEIAINLSGNSLGDDSFFAFLQRELSVNSVPADRVCLEITETAATKNLSKAIQFLKQVKQLGCKLALDDFGSGWSSFTYLKNFPADYLKIDGSFVRDMANNSVDTAMVQAINQVGHTLGMTTIAEWVENDALAAHLKALGVDWAQGYAFAAPFPLISQQAKTKRRARKLAGRKGP